jgi:hypothetical protein
MMKFEIKKRWNDEVAFTAEIEADELSPVGVKTALALKWAVAAGIAITGLALDLRGGTVTDCTVTNCNVTGGTPQIPIITQIHQRVYHAAISEGAFDMMTWGPEEYTPECETTRCRAGLVVHLAGQAGYALKSICGWQGAAWLIYKTSDPTIERVPDFFASNDDAMADMKRLAELEAARNAEVRP